MVEDMKRKVNLIVSMTGPDKALARELIMDLISTSWASVMDSDLADEIEAWIMEYEEGQ